MKKLYSILGASLLALGGMTAQAQTYGPMDMYLIGPFNNYGQDADLSEWKLIQGEYDTSEGTPIDETNLFTKTFSIPAGQFAVYFSLNNENLVPAVDGQIAGSNIEVPDGTSKYDYLASSGKAYWVYDGWRGLYDVSIQVDITSHTVEFLVDGEVEDVWYLRGEFNDYNPNGQAKWVLTNGYYNEDGDYEATGYTGTFKIPAGQLKFNLLQPSAPNPVFVPFDLNTYTAVDDIFTFENGSYTYIGFDYAFDEEEMKATWSNPDWQGGWITVYIEAGAAFLRIVDVTDQMSSIPDVEIPEEAPEFLFLNGKPNNFNPDENPLWQLSLSKDEDEEDVVYNGIINVPTNNFYFNFTYGESAYIIPASVNNGIISGSENDVDVEFVDGIFSDTFAFGDGQVFWQNNGFLGGEVEIVVNITQNTITFSYSELMEDQWYISGAFNQYNPGTGTNWALTPVDENGDEENGVYQGVFTIPADQFSFNFVDPYGTVWIPVSLSTETVVFEEGVYEGGMDLAYDDEEAKTYWVYPEWTGGKITITIDANTGELTIEEGDTSAISAIQKDSNVEAIYNLQGVKVSKDNLRKGIYIVNGKKVLVK